MNRPTTAKRRSRIRFQYPTAVVPKHEGKGKGKALFAPPSPAVGRHPLSNIPAGQSDDIFVWEDATSRPPHFSANDNTANVTHNDNVNIDDQPEYSIDDYFLLTEADQSLEYPPSKQAVSFVPVFSDDEDDEDDAEYDPNDKLMNSDLWLSSSGESSVGPLEFHKKRVPTIKENAKSHRFESQLGRALSVVKVFEDVSSSSSRDSEQQSSEPETRSPSVHTTEDDLLEELQQALKTDPTIPQLSKNSAASSDFHSTLDLQPTTPRPQPRTLFKTITALFFSTKKPSLPIAQPTITHTTLSLPPPQKPRIRRIQTGNYRSHAKTLPTVQLTSTTPRLITVQHFLDLQQQQPFYVNIPHKHHRGMSADSVLDRPGDVWSKFNDKYPEGMPGVGAELETGTGAGKYMFGCRASGDEEVEYQWAQGAFW